MAFDRLVRAGQAYDAAYHSEALSLATIAYLFVYDKGRSTVSLLTMVCRKEIGFRDTGMPINPRNLVSEHPLAVGRMEAGPEGRHLQYLPALDGTQTFVGEKEARFGAWWEATVIRDPQRREFSRKNLVFFFRNKMGGGHVSEGYDRLEQIAADAFSDLARTDAGGWVLESNGARLRPEFGVQFATMRQIGWELEQTLQRLRGLSRRRAALIGRQAANAAHGVGS